MLITPGPFPEFFPGEEGEDWATRGAKEGEDWRQGWHFRNAWGLEAPPRHLDCSLFLWIFCTFKNFSFFHPNLNGAIGQSFQASFTARYLQYMAP